MTAEDIDTLKREEIAQRRADLEEGRREGVVGEPLFEKLQTIADCAAIVEDKLPTAVEIVQTLRMAGEEIERLAGALYLITQEPLVPDAFGDREEFEKLDEIRKIHCSTLLIAGATLLGGGDDDDTATAIHVPG